MPHKQSKRCCSSHSVCYVAFDARVGGNPESVGQSPTMISAPISKYHPKSCIADKHSRKIILTNVI
ncbi:MAG TPA: hypothetical protein VL854_03030 [Nitrososphaeraceae archaeon]|nr:hypothetical protein [Nitrososphaeraceae archaeon]